MLDAYIDAFASYMRTGTVGALAAYCEADADHVRLRVYRNGFLKGCVDALRAGYPAVEDLVGEARFVDLARPYVEAEPPRRANLVGYGARFPEFVERSHAMHGLAYLASFARLDRAWSEVFFAEDPPAGGSASPGDDPERILSLCGSLARWARLVRLDWRAFDTWARLRERGLDRETGIEPGVQHVLIWRNRTDILHRALTDAECAFLSNLADGRSCERAAVAALEADPEFDLATHFATVLDQHLVTFRD